MNDITVLIPVSPMPSMPSTEVVDETIASIRERLPDAEIIIMFDGLPAWSLQYKENYEKFTQDMLWKINNMGNATPLLFDRHMHQSLMTKEALKLVRTPLILWSEQDTPLHNTIPFPELTEVVKTGYANVIRFYGEAEIHPDHKYLMLDETPIVILGQPFTRTRQWSGRPALISTKYFKMLAEEWDDQPRFIEHLEYGLVSEIEDFDKHRIHIYHPEGTIVRHKHLDGRRYGADHYDSSTS